MSVRTHYKLLGLAGAAALTIGTMAAPAMAASQPLTYNCPVFGAAGPGEDSVSADLDPGAIPAKLVAGQTVTNPATLSVHLDPFQTGLAATFGTSVSGTAVATGAKNTFPFNMTIPATPIPQTPGATMNVPAAGPAKIRPLKAGTWTVKAGDMTATLTVTGGAGGTQTLPVACTAPAGASAVFGTIAVSKDKSTTATKASYNAKKDTATGTAKVKGHFGLAGTGKVKFTLKKGTKTVKSMKVALKKGAAKAAFKKVKAKGKYKIVASFAGDAALKGSSGVAKFTVK